MKPPAYLSRYHGTASPYSLRDLLSLGFRYRRLILLSFLGMFFGAVFYILLQPDQYKAQSKILVQHERVYPIPAMDGRAAPRLSAIVTEEEINSEIELLRSRDLLERVVSISGPNQTTKRRSWWSRLFSPNSGVPARNAANTDSPHPDIPANRDISLAARRVLSHLRVEPLGRSTIIQATYTDRDPQQAADLLNTLTELYLEKHLAVRRPAGTFDFFQEEAQRYRQKLADAETQLSEFGHTNNVVSPRLEKENTLARIDEFEARLRETKAAIAGKIELIREIERQLASTSPRIITHIRTSDNRAVVQDLKSKLAALEMERIDLLAKYKPTYRAVQEVDEQIAHVRASLAAEEKVVLREESTDLDPTYEKLKTQLAVTRAELAALGSSAAETAQNLSAYRGISQSLQRKEIAWNDLLRARESAKENYEMYLRKQEEARIADALDKQRVLNVTIVEKATVPIGPSGPRRKMLILVAGVLAGMLSVAFALLIDFLRPSFHTPADVEHFLDVPVIAALPSHSSSQESSKQPLAWRE
jgi:uncharacterized protein involved in exopolysaccharide biosynthesis